LQLRRISKDERHLLGNDEGLLGKRTGQDTSAKRICASLFTHQAILSSLSSLTGLVDIAGEHKGVLKH
jgi:hypothetical protein